MYYYGYYKVKRSKIVESLFKLFFWLTMYFGNLTLLSTSAFFNNQFISFFFRVVSIFNTSFVVYYLYKFMEYSTDDEIEEKR